jgi:hypothetical protein
MASRVTIRSSKHSKQVNRKHQQWIPKIKIWEGTTAHGSVDTREGQNIANSLRLLFGAENVMARGEWSFEDLHNGKLAFVTHTRNLAPVFPFTTGQRTAESFVKTMFYHGLPENVRDIVDAHGHSTRGSLVDEPISVIHCACWTSFLEYGRANANFSRFQPDVGAWFLIVTKAGRVVWQKWLYKPFVYHKIEQKIYESNVLADGWAPSNRLEIERYFKIMLKDARFVAAVVADFHVGEEGAIAPPQYHDDEGRVRQVQKYTAANKRLFGYWQNFVALLKEVKPDEIWIAGDPLAGTQVFSRKTATVTQILDEQRQMFVELFRPLAPKRAKFEQMEAKQ